MSIRTRFRTAIPRQDNRVLAAGHRAGDRIAQLAEFAGEVGGDDRLVLDDENSRFGHRLFPHITVVRTG